MAQEQAKQEKNQQVDNVEELLISDLVERVSACRVCIEDPDGRGLPHTPRPVVRLSSKAKVCIAGQAPGIRVHHSGVPFDDPSGDRLRQWMGVSREVFYDQNRIAIVPMGFCFPGYDAKGGDLPPRKECRKYWHSQIFQAMPQLELVMVIGQYAQRHHLGSRKQDSMTKTVRQARQIWTLKQNPRYLPLPHPSWRNSAWLKANPWFESEILPFLRTELHRLL